MNQVRDNADPDPDRAPRAGPKEPRHPCVCLDDPSEVHAVQAESPDGDVEIDSEPPDKPEPEHFPGSHPLSLEALVRRAHDGLGHPGRDRFLRI